MADQSLQEPQVGGDAADAELAQRPVHARDRPFRRRRPGGDFLEQGIVERCDHRAREGGAAVEPDAEAGRAAIGGDAAIVGDEFVLRVLGGDSALDRVAVQRNLVLGRYAAGRAADREALGDGDLRLDQVDAGDFFGHGVLDLDARIDLDEVEAARIGIVEELDRAGVAVAGRARQTHRGRAEPGPQPGVDIGRRRALHDFLVAPLQGAVAFEQVHDVAVPVGQDLDL